MKTALDFYARGKQKEANADEYDRSRYYSRDRFICADGFSYEGAMFTVSEQGGKKIRYGDSITTDEMYYWVRSTTASKFYSGNQDEKMWMSYIKR